MDDDSEQLARFEEMGEEAVRIHALTAGFATANQRLAIKWLQEKAHESKRRNEFAHLRAKPNRANCKERCNSGRDCGNHHHPARDHFHTHFDLRLDLSAPLEMPLLTFAPAFALRLPSFIAE